MKVDVFVRFISYFFVQLSARAICLLRQESSLFHSLR